MQAWLSYKTRFTSEELKRLFFSKIGVYTTIGLDKISPKKFEEDINEQIDLIIRKTASSSYCFTNYRQVLIPKGLKDFPREICLPTIKDKLALGALSSLLNDVYGDDCKTPHPQIVVDEVSRSIASMGYDSFIKIDIEKFYSSIDHERLMKVIRGKIRKPEIVNLIISAITTPSATWGIKAKERRAEGVPQGLSISNQLANILFHNTDRLFSIREDCKYFRYVDDILILCNSEDLAKVGEDIRKAISQLSLIVNEKKSFPGKLGKHRLDYLGYSFLNNQLISVRAQSVHNIEKSLEGHIRARKGQVKNLHWAWRLNLKITGCRITEDGETFERYGWLFYYSRINDVSLLCHLDWLVSLLLKRYQAEEGLEVKHFKKAYYEIRYKSDTTHYIPTFDMRMPVEEKRSLLKKYFNEGNIDEMSDEQINEVFNSSIRREARRLERDVSPIS